MPIAFLEDCHIQKKAAKYSQFTCSSPHLKSFSAAQIHSVRLKSSLNSDVAF